MDDNISLILKIIKENPVLSAAFSGALVTVAAFFKPIAVALQRALIRRIDQAWPDDCTVLSHEEKVKRTLDIVNSGTPYATRSMIEKVIRKHKSNPPPSNSGKN